MVGEDKSIMGCNLTRGADHLHVKGLLDTGADVTVIPERLWLSHWDLQPMAGKIHWQKSIEGPDRRLASVHTFVTDYKGLLWG